MSVTKLPHRDMAVIILTLAEFRELLALLSYALAKEIKDGHGTERTERWLELTNSINEGNPDWEPYDMEMLKELIGPFGKRFEETTDAG